MDIKVKDKVNQRHVGRNLQRIRVYLGMKQEALASDLGVSQQEISKIEKQDEIEDGLLTKIAEVLGISTDVIKDFDVEIADVKGASIGENKRLTVTIKDNDSSFYETLSGTWVFTGTASATNVSNVPVGFSVRVNTAEEGTEAYEHYLVCSNKNGFDPDNDIEWEFSWRLHYEYDSEAQKTYLSIVPGEDVASYGPYTIRFRRLALDGSTSDVYRGEYDVETKTVTFENANLIGDMYKDGLIQIQKFRLFGCKMEHIR